MGGVGVVDGVDAEDEDVEHVYSGSSFQLEMMVESFDCDDELYKDEKEETGE